MKDTTVISKETFAKQEDFIKGHFQKLKKMKEFHLERFHHHINKIKALRAQQLQYLRQGFYRHQDFIALVCSICLSLFSLFMLGKIYFIS